MNSTASQSSSSGCDGGLPLRPKLAVVSTSGRPKCHAQTWFTATRAVSGFAGLVTQFASAVRRPLLVFVYVGVSGVYASPGGATALRAASTTFASDWAFCAANGLSLASAAFARWAVPKVASD